MGRARRRAEEVAQVNDGRATPAPESQLDAEAELRTLSSTPTHCDDGPEFSSEPMPAAFPAFFFLGVGVAVCVALAFLL